MVQKAKLNSLQKLAVLYSEPFCVVFEHLDEECRTGVR